MLVKTEAVSLLLSSMCLFISNNATMFFHLSDVLIHKAYGHIQCNPAPNTINSYNFAISLSAVSQTNHLNIFSWTWWLSTFDRFQFWKTSNFTFQAIHRARCPRTRCQFDYHLRWFEQQLAILVGSSKLLPSVQKMEKQPTQLLDG